MRPAGANKIRLWKRPQIDANAWDKMLAGGSFAHPCLQAWWLDAASPGWMAVAPENFCCALPVFPRRKMGVHYACMPQFVQQSGIIGRKEAGLDYFAQAAASFFPFIEISGNEADTCTGAICWRNNFCLDISQAYTIIYNNYRGNARRNLRLFCTGGAKLDMQACPADVIGFFKQHNGKNKLSGTDFASLDRLVSNAKAQEQLVFAASYSASGQINGAALFVNWQGRHVYLISAADTHGREQRSMYGIIDEYIRLYCGKPGSLLDFEGSSIPGVAEFYSSFCAQNRPFPLIKINKLPWPLRCIKR
jgi:hypothetical protein